MNSAPTLSQVVRVNARFVRSISLVRDAGLPNAIQGYILMPTGRDVLIRMADAMPSIVASTQVK